MKTPMSATAHKVVTHEIVERKLPELFIDPNVQRGLRKQRVKEISDDFDAAALGVLTTSFRSPDQIHVVDGQHRVRAAEMAGYTGVVQTMEYRGLSIPEEAALFRKLNNTRQVSAIDRFLVACVEQNPSALHLAAIIADNGWAVAGYAGEAKLSAIGSLQRVYALDPNAAKAAVHVLTKAYGHRPAAMQGALVEGLGRMIARYGYREIDLDDLVKRLGGFPGGPDALVGNARGQLVAKTGNLWAAVARLLVNIYNERRRTTKIAAWD